jgi:tetratricopeptide (TPR) repeat protein
MEWQSALPEISLDQSGRIILLEAEAGQPRRDCLHQWLVQAQRNGATTWLLACDFDEDGPWTGLRGLFQDILPKLRTHAPDLINSHDYELATIFPALQRTLTIRNPTLTDISEGKERVRNYPADRPNRIVHGLIDLLKSWYQYTGAVAWVIACDSFDCSSTIVRLFFSELMRRCEQQLNVMLILTADHGAGESAIASFNIKDFGPAIRLYFASSPNSHISGGEMARQAQILEDRVGDDLIEVEIHIAPLIRYWQLSDQPEKVLRYIIRAFAIYTKQALYEDALKYGESALAYLERYSPEDTAMRWYIAARLYFCYIGSHKPLLAFQSLDSFIAKTDDPTLLLYCYYFKSMLYARFLPQRDFAKAEAYLGQGLDELARSDLPAHEKVFQTVFNRNGLALIRHFQKRYDEAVELCQWGYEQLNVHLSPSEHRLHRSVLLYNMAQVYVAAKSYDEALTHYTAAMEMDPNYSEYYNERGNVYLKMDRLDDAVSDYLQAIELSPPYQEVWTNLGQCYRLIGRMAEAIAAYSRALDLDPHVPVALAGRGEAFEALEQVDEALADYSASLELKPDQPLVLANRAILYYQAGRLHESLADLDGAIALAPQTAELYQNRAVALTDLGRLDEAAGDLRTYLDLRPDAEDRDEVGDKLLGLQVGSPVE